MLNNIDETCFESEIITEKLLNFITMQIRS